MKIRYRLILTTLMVVVFFNLHSTIGNENLDYSKSDLRYTKNESFGFGERLEYKVGYKYITAGRGFFTIGKEPVYRNGRACYNVQFGVNSLPSLEWIYKVSDRYSSLIDIHSLTPWEFEQHIREGKFKRDFKARFDQVSNKAYVEDKSYNVPENVHDIVSALYYIRATDLHNKKKGDVIMLQNFFKDTTYNLGVKILGRETVKVEAGTFRTVVVEPLVVEGGLFKSEGRIVVWLTDDDRKIPVKVGTQIVIGFVGAELTAYSGVRGAVSAKID